MITGLARRIPRSIELLALILSLGSGLIAGEIRGSVVIKKQLTKPRVTASVSLYQRGTAVELGQDAAKDPLALERSRVVVYIEGRLPSAPVKATLQQINRRFSPEILVITPGSTVSFPNMDPIFHNVFSLSKPKMFDLGNYPKGDSRTVTFNEPGIVYVNCHLHPNMNAAIVVAPNSFNTQPDQNGNFELRDVPPGKYTVVAWHRSAGFFRQTLEVSGERASEVDFLIPFDEFGHKIAMTMK